MTIKEQYQQMFSVSKVYSALFNTQLFKAFIYNLVDKPPGEIDVTSILSDTYNFYIKYSKCWGDIQWQDAVNEAKQIEHKYNCDMCNEMLVQLLDLIEKQFKQSTRG